MQQSVLQGAIGIVSENGTANYAEYASWIHLRSLRSLELKMMPGLLLLHVCIWDTSPA